MSFDFVAARENMIEGQVRTSDVTDAALVGAMRRVDRHTLCSPDQAVVAYADRELPIAPGVWLMRPREAAKLLQAVSARPGEHGLCIGAPYLAAVLEEMGLTVDSREAGLARDVEPNAYDLIVSEASVVEAPQSWLDGLRPFGRLAVVVRRGLVGHATVWRRGPDTLSRREMFDASPPYLAGFEPAPAFSF